MHLKRGKIICSKEALSGYWMIMDFNKTTVTLSPLFWADKILYQDIPIALLDGYKKHDPKSLHPIVQARYDHEKMRRLKKL